MTVLHVIPSISKKHGGPSYAVEALAKASRCAGIQPVIATTDDDGDKAHMAVALDALIERDGVPHIFFGRDLLPYKVSFGLRRWLNRHVVDFDLVHIHALFSFSSRAAARAAIRRQVPYIIRPLGVLNRWGMENRRPLLKRLSLQMIELPILRGAAAIHYTTEAERLEASAVHSNIAKVPSFVIPLPVDIPSEDSDRADFVRRFPVVAGKRVVLFLSRLDPKKGIELLLKSFARVCASQKGLMLVIAGDGAPTYVESLQRLSEELQISQRVLWTGNLGPSDKAAAFASATVFVLPSYSENFGVAAAEALVAGVPCILSDQVALAADAQRAGAAVVVRAEVEELSSAMVHVLEDIVLRERLSANGAALARTLYSHEAVGEALAEQYRLIVSRSKPGS